jgi:hypothetical protein
MHAFSANDSAWHVQIIKYEPNCCQKKCALKREITVGHWHMNHNPQDSLYIWAYLSLFTLELGEQVAYMPQLDLEIIGSRPIMFKNLSTLMSDSELLTVLELTTLHEFHKLMTSVFHKLGWITSKDLYIRAIQKTNMCSKPLLLIVIFQKQSFRHSLNAIANRLNTKWCQVYCWLLRVTCNCRISP